MKTEPRDIDREAARLFVPAPGMRVWFLHYGTPSRILNGAVIARWERVCYDFAVETSGLLGLDALDTDDPATVGCMLAQVEDAAGKSVEMVRYSFRALTIWACDPLGAYGWTRAAALVAAMRALKGDPTR
jgi:hypothetical protein